VPRSVIVTATAVLILSVCACSSTPAAPDEKAKPPAKEKPSALSEEEMIQRAEAAVEGELPKDVPIWEGVTFAGSAVDESTVCVDRRWPKGGGVDNKGGSAGYVLVTFPAEALGEPTDGVCSDVSAAPTEDPLPEVQVPDEFASEPGLVTHTDLGNEWPLTVEYGVLECDNATAGQIDLQIATFTGPDGTVYALNGTAKDHTNAADIDPIWADDPEVEGLKISIGSLIDRALALC
jgi:hypothetical protein